MRRRVSSLERNVQIFLAGRYRKGQYGIVKNAMNMMEEVETGGKRANVTVWSNEMAEAVPKTGAG